MQAALNEDQRAAEQIARRLIGLDYTISSSTINLHDAGWAFKWDRGKVRGGVLLFQP